jgi:hypothetical protein
MALILPYPTMSGSLAPSGAATIDQFASTTVHSSLVHNNPHAKLLANDVAIKAAFDLLETTVSASNPPSWDWTQSVFSTKGYQKLPGGLILQWATGIASSGQDSTQTISWLIAFPFICLNAFASTENPGAYTGMDSMYQIVLFSATNIVVQAQWWAGPSTTIIPHVFAIGY